MYVTPFSPFRDGSARRKVRQGERMSQMSTKKGFSEVTLLHVDFKPGFYRSRKCPIRVKTTPASVEQLS